MTDEIQQRPSTTCPYCAEEIKADAKKCKHCGEFLDPQLAGQRAPQKPINPGTAAVLSLLIPGAGQMYKGQVGLGFLWLFLVPVGYLMLILPGLVLHIFCVVDAHQVFRYDGTRER